MSRRKQPRSRVAKAAPAPAVESGSAPEDALLKYLPSSAAVRETIESVVIAFVLAFLFRTFEAEAFVIPTGSMAPTLMGRHKDLTCPMCGMPFQVSASDEVDPVTGEHLGELHEVGSCTCPNCRYSFDCGPLNPQDQSYPSYKGDRILVNKFAYQFGEPRRWDVAVFKYPGGAATNYIKRIIGLPNETIKISHGDVFVRKKDEAEFQIARKPPPKVAATLQLVYDNDHVVTEMIEHGWPARWQGWPTPEGSMRGDWITSEDFKSFHTDGSAHGEAWLRYRNFVPTFRDWERILNGASIRPEAQLVSDFAAYNTNRSVGEVGHPPNLAPDANSLGLHWVGDLAFEGTVEVESSAGQLILELVEGGRRFQCRIDLANGEALLSIVGLDQFGPQGQTSVRGPGSHDIRFANVDNQLLLWVDGGLVEFDAPTVYPALGNRRPQQADLAPVGVAAADGAAVRLSHLKVLRDVYYIAEKAEHNRPNGSITDFLPGFAPFDALTRQSVANYLSNESCWDAFLHLREVQFDLGDDEFLALGDNSARSKDSRLWPSEGFEYFVSRRLLIGKALFIYWPHSWNRIPGTGIPFPFFPNFARMGFVR